MKNRIFPVWFTISFIFFLMCTAATPAAGGESTLISQLTVRGNATLQVPADQLQLQVGIVSEAKTAKQALRENTAKAQQIEQALKDVGLTGKEYKTGRFQVQPRWSTRPQKHRGQWQPAIIGYRVSNFFAIKTRRLELAGKIIEACTKAGANSINSIIFDLADPQKYRAEAIAAATANARADAGALASAAEVKLGKILNLSLDNAGSSPLRSRVMNFDAGMAKAAAPALNLSPGEVTVRAGVAITYKISGPAGK
ncbi:MAG: hypothetical protein DRH04_03570 [Deltaproteobacteria bacterium]|nr:MAG: hypothetical protein DRH04_03570 [Deltaproteobacteria bacterium]